MYNILVCDDEMDIVSALEIYLSAEGYNIYKAYYVEEAIVIINKNEIHLILLDIMMPVMDGLSAMRKIRETSNVPVILLTAKSEDTDKIAGLNLGADDYNLEYNWGFYEIFRRRPESHNTLIIDPDGDEGFVLGARADILSGELK